MKTFALTLSLLLAISVLPAASQTVIDLPGRVVRPAADYVPGLPEQIGTTLIVAVRDPGTGERFRHEIKCPFPPFPFHGETCSRFVPGDAVLVRAWVVSGYDNGRYGVALMAKEIHRIGK